ncbi:MAG TPA: Fis family transcriptional regulator [Betaproteobacteria bacterium]|nr:Fis family transcriptional regulator [Betaproteobacteria bacterium]
MPNDLFSRLNPIAFLQTFVIQSMGSDDRLAHDGREKQATRIERLGLDASHCFETAYRQEFSHKGPIDPAYYADMICRIKNKIGGNFSRASSEPGMVRVVNSRCPFGEAVKHAPELCRMTSSMFGGIAARHFGYAKVVFDKRIAMEDDNCQVCIYIDPALAGQQSGDEYFQPHGPLTGESAAARARIEREMHKIWRHSQDSEEDKSSYPSLVAHSPAMKNTLEMVDVVAPTKATVLITGETGVGKEVIARAIHAMSARNQHQFLAVNCGAIPENLAESTLFGHERGAFTGAYAVRHGFFERAEKGTLFLDEIDSLPLAAQVRLLRVLQEGEFERVGGKQSLSANVRIIAAANNRLDELVNRGVFRLDLYYRLAVIVMHIPPLRERLEDIPPLVDSLLAKLSTKYHKPRCSLDSSAMVRIMAHDWPGNVRELENTLERSFLFCKGPSLHDIHLFSALSQRRAQTGREIGIPLRDAKRQAADQVEKSWLEEALTRFQGNIGETAGFLGLTPRAVYQKLGRHHIDPAHFRQPPP